MLHNKAEIVLAVKNRIIICISVWIIHYLTSVFKLMFTDRLHNKKPCLRKLTGIKFKLTMQAYSYRFARNFNCCNNSINSPVISTTSEICDFIIVLL